MMIALKRYRAAANKRGVRYCLVEKGGRLDGIGIAGLPRLVENFTDPNYQTVLDERPLLFLFAQPTRFTKDDWSALGRMAVAAGSKPPYIVLMGWNPTQDAKQIVTLGFDAVSAYARPGTYTMQPPRFAQVRDQIREQLWDTCARERIPSLTFASAGWDMRTRNERPPSVTSVNFGRTLPFILAACRSDLNGPLGRGKLLGYVAGGRHRFGAMAAPTLTEGGGPSVCRPPRLS